MSNVTHIATGAPIPDKTAPNPALIKMITEALRMAESGQLQSYIGTGFTHDGLRVSTWGNYHDDVYQMLGSINWLASEYINRMTKEKNP